MSDEIVLLSGTKIYASNGLISINEDLEIRQGYDGILADHEYVAVEHWTVADRLDLAKMMIDRWTRYAKGVLHEN